ncbi:hypothetical protein [Lysinibacillus sp. NPDC059133]|uniref:hypothetical protein n=1 Tax=Lysinibacillus sp. NPDC059133 TaxID=3346737 RepID=UPI0036A72B28
MYDITQEELEDNISKSKDFKDYKIYATVVHDIKKNSHKPFCRKEEFVFNDNGSKQSISFHIYRDVVEVSSWDISIPSYAQSISRNEDWRKELTSSQRINEATSLYLRKVYK